MTTVKELKEHLNNSFNDNDIIAYSIWQREDVLMRAEENGIELTNEQADKAIELMDRTHDCTIGLTWDSVDSAIDTVIY